ncbi:MAG: glutaredoxin [Candidatus Marinimicrobia bacterium]|nr:glutaredoxin [Candidatus Neomarinimicrobiota bacterium]|tara:strand:+ start:5084 stop:5332 length:249 start_codon:yes stop_codon:yes gene_type:complete
MIKIYSTTWCQSCRFAKSLFETKNIEYEEINIEEVGISRLKLKEITGGHTVPQIVINGTSIGGYDQLIMLEQMNKLDELISL